MEKVKLYLDWSIISNLKRGGYAEINEFINNHRNCLLVPYSFAHLNDIKNSYAPNNNYFENDLDTIMSLPGEHCIDWKNNTMMVGYFTREQLLEKIKQSKTNSDLFNATCSIKEFYLTIRKDVKEKELLLDSTCNNWKVEDVIKNINNLLPQKGINCTFQEYASSYVEDKTDECMCHAVEYLLLDIMGYKTDDISKPSKDESNIINDGWHSFFATYCDYFVVDDKILRQRTLALFHYHNIETKVIRSNELIDTLKPVLGIS